MVTNAQFPEPLRDLPPVTQLYLSIDAGDEISLKKVDRPLHRDFWQRLVDCVDIVRDRKERTVFRYFDRRTFAMFLLLICLPG